MLVFGLLLCSGARSLALGCAARCRRCCGCAMAWRTRRDCVRCLWCPEQNAKLFLKSLYKYKLAVVSMHKCVSTYIHAVRGVG
jgi:hypothetical protein